MESLSNEHLVTQLSALGWCGCSAHVSGDVQRKEHIEEDVKAYQAELLRRLDDVSHVKIRHMNGDIELLDVVMPTVEQAMDPVCGICGCTDGLHFSRMLGLYMCHSCVTNGLRLLERRHETT